MSSAIAVFICEVGLESAGGSGQNTWPKGRIAMKATGSQLDVVVVASAKKLAEGILELFLSDARKAIDARERFCMAISRRTPRPFFELLGAEPRSQALAWEKIHLFWVDECCGWRGLRNDGGDAAAYGLISKVGIPAENVHRICSRCRGCEYVASIYEETIYRVVGVKENGVPRFDLILLRMEADAHVGSLLPTTYAFFDTGDLVHVTYFMDRRRAQITLTNAVLCAASHIAVLVCGEKSAAVLRDVLTSERDELRYPIHAIWPILNKVTWVVDRAASKFLQPSCQ